MTARELSFSVLKTASKSGTYSNIALDNALKRNELNDADRGLVTAIVMGVTERRLTLDYIIDKLAADPSRIESETRDLLRMGIYQIIFMDKIPEYAAVNETVSLAPRRSRGFVNAVMRSLLRKRGSGELDSLFPPEDDGVEHLSVKYSFPKEVCARFLEIYGLERAKNIFEVFNRPPKLTLRINTLKIDREGYLRLLDERNIAYRLSERLENAIILDNVSFSSLPGFGEGYFFVQDEASQICVEALGALEDEIIIDSCACPGSKSFGTAIRMKNRGEVRSFDLHESKLKLIDKGAERLGIDIIKSKVRDGRDLNVDMIGLADRVLCDVPCSGLGVIAKKPEIRYKSLDDFARLPEIQYAIVDNCSKYVKCGGYLVYSTCTVLPEENELNVARFLAEHCEFAPCDFKIGNIESENGMISLAPDIHGTDGFFVAKFKKIK